jgi:AcrR family transcriptional regulator
MPMRGVRIPELNEQLFAAAERIMARDGAAGLTSRALTDEAGCAKGVLHNHFDGLDGFLAEFALDRVRRTEDAVSGLPAEAGHRTVSDNLAAAALTVFGSGATQIAALITARPALAARVLTTLGPDGQPFGQIQAAFADYLRAEQELGRLAATADADTVAFTLIGAVHHLFFTASGSQPDPGRVRGIVTTLLGDAHHQAGT